jgi:hypothetical protein
MATFENAEYVSVGNVISTSVGRDQYNLVPNNLSEEKVLATLKPASRNGYDVPRCMAGTRESIFREIDLWLDGMFLLHAS